MMLLKSYLEQTLEVIDKPVVGYLWEGWTGVLLATNNPPHH